MQIWRKVTPHEEKAFLTFIALAVNIVSIFCQDQPQGSIIHEIPLSKFISPSNPLRRQSILPGETAYFRIQDLKPLSSYEIKLSYPATMPAKFELDLVSLRDEYSRKSRQLLNTEKMTFVTPEDSVLFCQETILRIKVTPEAVAWNKEIQQERILFSVSVGPIIFGAPVECLPHAAWIAFLFLLSPFLVRFVHKEIVFGEYFLKQKM